MSTTRIAIVEDNPDNQLVFEAILEERFAIELFDAGPPALEAFAARAPNLVLLDISLPEMDGIEVLRRLRTIAGMEDTPVIALTAHAMAGDRERFLEAGFDDYVAKPVVDEEVLFETIARHLSVGGAGSS